MKSTANRSILITALVVLVIAITTLGVIGGVPAWLRGPMQGLAAVAGAVLGSKIQNEDSRVGIAGAGRSALANIAALAHGIRELTVTVAEHRRRMDSSPPRTVEAHRYATDALLTGIDGQARGLLAQARSTAEVWLPYVPDNEKFLEQLAGGPR